MRRCVWKVIPLENVFFYFKYWQRNCIILLGTSYTQKHLSSTLSKFVQQNVNLLITLNRILTQNLNFYFPKQVVEKELVWPSTTRARLWGWCFFHWSQWLFCKMHVSSCSPSKQIMEAFREQSGRLIFWTSSEITAAFHHESNKTSFVKDPCQYSPVFSLLWMRNVTGTDCLRKYFHYCLKC